MIIFITKKGFFRLQNSQIDASRRYRSFEDKINQIMKILGWKSVLSFFVGGHRKQW